MSAPDTPFVSIVVPAYNSERFVGLTLQSIQHQSFANWECVVVDDGSEDSTARVADALAADDERFRVVRQSNGGASRARNTGFLHTNPASRYVTFMDADDVWLVDCLQQLVASAETTRDAIGAHGLGEFIDGDGAMVEPGRYPATGRSRRGLRGRSLITWPLDEPTTFEVLINGNVLFPPGLVLVRRTIYEKVGPFDESYNGPEDWDMLIRLSRHGGLAFCNEVVLHCRRHDNNLGAGPGVARQAWLVRCKAFYSSENSPDQQATAEKGWRAYQLARQGVLT